MADDEVIVSATDVPTASTFLFTLRDVTADERKEAILVRLPEETAADGGAVSDDADSITAWLNYCQHFTHIKLDKGSGAPMRDGELVCANHGAYFESGSGLCTYGPCEGAYLTEVAVTVRDGDVCLTDDDYEFVATGPIETDEFDLSSKSNYEF
jgi:nitrite reductase/ring-hydroxylating ferredoxin subunit